MSYYAKEYNKICLECGAKLRSSAEIILHKCIKENNGDISISDNDR